MKIFRHISTATLIISFISLLLATSAMESMEINFGKSFLWAVVSLAVFAGSAVGVCKTEREGIYD